MTRRSAMRFIRDPAISARVARVKRIRREDEVRAKGLYASCIRVACDVQIRYGDDALARSFLRFYIRFRAFLPSLRHENAHAVSVSRSVSRFEGQMALQIRLHSSCVIPLATSEKGSKKGWEYVRPAERIGWKGQRERERGN